LYAIRNQATGLTLWADAADGLVQGRTANAESSEQRWLMLESSLASAIPTKVETNISALGKLYPDGWNASIDGNPCAEYTSTDSKFRTKQPTWAGDGEGGGTATMLLDHIRGGIEKDDHATLMVGFLRTGQVCSASLDWTLGGQWAIEWGTKIIVKVEDEINDAASEEAGKAAVEMADLLSAGALTPLDPLISKAASEMTSKLISSLFSNLNAMLSKELGHDDGGRQTFIAVVNHNMNKLCASMQTTPSFSSNTTITFSTADFASVLYDTLSEAYGSDIDETSVTWDGDQTTEYYVAGTTSDGTHKFSTWKPDSSVYPFGEGLYVSTKIDLKHGSAAKDGHYVVMLGVSSNGNVLSAQASLEYPPDQNVDSYLSAVFTGTDAISQLYQDLTDNKAEFAGPNVVKMNLESMVQCVRVTPG
jgi:hypothetical protein